MLRTREATPADAEAVAALLDTDRRVAERLCRDRAVRVAVEPGEDDSENETTAPGESGADLRAVLAYEVRPDAVHVARFGGSERGVESLLTEPERFAESEGLPVEAVVPAADEESRAVLEAVGFEEVGEGPSFEGETTVRYRLAGSGATG